MTRVSIITPSYNQAQFLRQAMVSVLEQDFTPLEYLVVDGGSTDGSVAIIKEQEERLAWWVTEPDSGQADAINKALAHARGDVVAWLNSDDLYLPGAVRAGVQALEAHPDAVLVYGNMQAVDAEGRIINRLRYGQLNFEDLLCFQIIGQPATFMRRRALEAAGGLDASFHCLLDHHLWIRLAQLGPILHVNETWASARFHAAAKNRISAEEFGKEAFRILDWAAQERDIAPVLKALRRRALAAAHRVNARYLVDAERPRRALLAWLRAFFIYPAVALQRLNLLGAAMLDLVGLGVVRKAILRRRQRRLSG
jgi:GT2 family glycosyltransferase